MTPTEDAHKDLYRLVGRRIRGERNRRNLTQDDLAAAIGLKRTSVTNIEKGKQKILLHTFFDIAKALGVPPKDLLSAIEPENDSIASTALPAHLSPSVRHWIISGVSSAQKSPLK